MDGVSLSYTCMASAISGGLRVHAGTGLGRLLTVLNSLLKLITVLGSSAYRKSSLSSSLKLITVLGSSAFQKALTGKKWAGRVGPWASRFLDVYTSTLPDFQTSRRLHF